MSAADILRAKLAQKEKDDHVAAVAADKKYTADVAKEKARGLKQAASELASIIENISAGVLTPEYKRTGYVHITLWTHYERKNWERNPPSYEGDYAYRNELASLLRAEGFTVKVFTEGSNMTDHEDEIGCWMQVSL